MIISIITVCLNDDQLERTITSVLSQSYQQLDYLIIDGGSTHPVTVSVLNKYRPNNNVRILSEKDNGIYDAMNKGIKIAKGEYLLFLNSGDRLFGESVIADFVHTAPAEELIYGDMEYISADSRGIGTFPDSLRFSYLAENYLPHPSCFFRKDLFDKYGLYDTTYSVVADWAFMLNALCRFNAVYRHMPQVISSFHMGGVSSSALHGELISAERKRFLNENFALFMPDHQENSSLRARWQILKRSRLRKYLSYFFKQLAINE